MKIIGIVGMMYGCCCEEWEIVTTAVTHQTGLVQ